MSEKERSNKETENWVRCTGCGHKLFKLVRTPRYGIGTVPAEIEVKCHSCKTLVTIKL